ncbi:hypothetical protein [Mammaliicoccus lentus]|jgi:hypothetical protein|uniref:hypothetical protein n=1 Tax=Mammaliicoccus lentus TaxID=42858 RepID=UPI003518E96F
MIKPTNILSYENNNVKNWLNLQKKIIDLAEKSPDMALQQAMHEISYYYFNNFSSVSNNLQNKNGTYCLSVSGNKNFSVTQINDKFYLNGIKNNITGGSISDYLILPINNQIDEENIWGAFIQLNKTSKQRITKETWEGFGFTEQNAISIEFDNFEINQDNLLYYDQSKNWFLDDLQALLLAQVGFRIFEKLITLSKNILTENLNNKVDKNSIEYLGQIYSIVTINNLALSNIFNDLENNIKVDTMLFLSIFSSLKEIIDMYSNIFLKIGGTKIIKSNSEIGYYYKCLLSLSIIGIPKNSSYYYLGGNLITQNI